MTGLLSVFKKRQYHDRPSARRKRRTIAACTKARRRERLAD